MLSPEEEKFLHYWSAQRLNKKQYIQKISVGLPLFAFLVVAFFVNFLSGWYRKADKELSQHSSLIFVLLFAVAAIGVFLTIFSKRHRWEQNEAEYHRLSTKKQQLIDGDRAKQQP